MLGRIWLNHVFYTYLFTPIDPGINGLTSRQIHIVVFQVPHRLWCTIVVNVGIPCFSAGEILVWKLPADNAVKRGFSSVGMYVDRLLSMRYRDKVDVRLSITCSRSVSSFF